MSQPAVAAALAPAVVEEAAPAVVAATGQREKRKFDTKYQDGV